MTENNYLPCDNRVAIVTGGSRGIGRAIATVLSRRSACVVLADRRVEIGQKAAAEISAITGHTVIATEVDISCLEKAQAMERAGRLGSGQQNLAADE